MTQKRLLLVMRHAKSSWKDDSMSDEERPLNKRGRETARLVGEYLRDHELVPDAILASSAVRAQETAERVNESGGFDVELHTAPEMYLSGADAYLRAIGRMDAAIQRLLVIGHNPDSETLIKHLTGKDERMPTAAVACIDVSARDWTEFAANPRGKLVEMLRPKALFGDGSDA